MRWLGVAVLAWASTFAGAATPVADSFVLSDCQDGTFKIVCPGGLEAFSYPGIPYPTALQPAAIMPTEPTAANTRAGWPYDPVLTATPTWTDASNQYYVDGGDAGCNDSNNGGRGSPASPRCNIQGLTTSGNGTWTLSAGDQVFIVGGGNTYGGDNDVQNINMPGTEANPIWVIGVGADRPELRFQRFFVGAGGLTHTFFDNVHFRAPNDGFRMQFTGGDSEYITFRNLECSGSEGTQSGSSRRCFSIGGSETSITQFLMFYDVEIYGLGRWQDDYTTNTDLHGIQTNFWSRYIWIINSDIYNVQGDSFQCGNSNWWDFNYPSRPHYMFVGGTDLHDNYENAYDQKGCYHVVVSTNHVYNITHSQKEANNSAVITEQDSEGHIGGKHTWFLNNLFENVGVALSLQATTDDAYPVVANNEIRSVNSAAINYTQRCYSGEGPETCADGADIALNTFNCGGTATGLQQPQNNGTAQTIRMHGNLFHDCVDGPGGDDVSFESYAASMDITYMYNSNYRPGGTATLPTSLFDTYSASENLLNTDHLLTNPAGGDLTLQSGSPALDYVDVAPPWIADFLSRYPSSMTDSVVKDRAGTVRPVNSLYDIGAFERP